MEKYSGKDLNKYLIEHQKKCDKMHVKEIKKKIILDNNEINSNQIKLANPEIMELTYKFM